MPRANLFTKILLGLFTELVPCLIYFLAGATNLVGFMYSYTN